jgi:hypothetical protein
MNKMLKTEDILKLSFRSHDLGMVVTVKKYLSLLLERLWVEEEGFNGKRPFGNSGWQSELATCFIRAELLKGEIDPDGYPDQYNRGEVNAIALKCIRSFSD